MLLLMVMLLWRRPNIGWCVSLLLLEMLWVNALIAVNGAASNPFNAVLLLPVVLAFMLLPGVIALLLLAASCLAQLSQLWLLSEHNHHSSAMTSHYYGMVIGFVLTSMLVAVVVWYLRMQLVKREEAIQQLRERQLRDEQLLAIGTAAAQLTHDMATPLQSISLLLEEVLQQHGGDPLLSQLAQQFARVEQHLGNWRTVADDVREHRLRDYPAASLWRSLRQLLLLARPEASIHWHWPEPSDTAAIKADGTLLPALTNIIINACIAAAGQRVAVSASIHGGQWVLQIENPTPALSQTQLETLGWRIVPSDNGHGLGAILSNATVEKFRGQVSWQHREPHVITTVKLPLETYAADSRH